MVIAPFSRWHVGKIMQVNKRRIVSENVTASFYAAKEGATIASCFIATAEEYGLAAEKKWAMLKDIPMVLSDDDEALSTIQSKGALVWGLLQ